MKYHEYIRMNPLAGEVGLEVETEASSNYRFVPGIERYWHPHVDGSLRTNGMEYVFLTPYDRDSTLYEKAMECLAEQAKVTKFIQSNYSSVHVHLNMLNKEVIHIANFLCLYFIFEEVLTEYCGPNRYSNLFCLNTSRAELVYKTAKEIIQAIADGSGSGYIRSLNNGTLKYSGINLVPLRNLGSLEVRTHPGTVDVTEINRWVDILMCLYRKADTFKDPVEIVNRLLGYKSRQDFLEYIFGKYSEYLPTENLQKKIEEGIWYATSIAGSVQWKDFGSKKSDKKLRGSALNLTAVEQWVDIYNPMANTFPTGAPIAAGTWTTVTQAGGGGPVGTIQNAVNFIHPTTDQ